MAINVDICLPELYDYQQKMRDGFKRFNIVDCGRRTGKTVFDIDMASDIIFQGGRVGWFASKFEYLEDAWMDINEIFAPIIKNSRQSPSHIMTFKTKARLYGFSLNTTGAGRSKMLDGAVIDEAGEAKDLENQFEKQILPSLADRAGWVIMSGTPKGRNGFYKYHQKGVNGEKDYISWTLPSCVNPNPNIRAEYERARLTCSERTFRQEWNAEFLADAGGVFRNVRECSIIHRGEYTYNPHHEYFAVVDWGRVNDFSFITIWDMNTLNQVDSDRYNQIEYGMQRERIKAMYDKWHLTGENVRVEGNSIGYTNAEELNKDGYPVSIFYTDNAKKARWVDEFAGALEHQRIGLLEDEVQIDELESFESTLTPTGLYKYAAPANQHDDTVIPNIVAYHYLKSADWSDMSDSTKIGKTQEQIELDAYNAEWAERMKTLREKSLPPNQIEDFLNEDSYVEVY